MSLTAAVGKFILQNTTKSKKNISAVNASGVAIAGTRSRLIAEGWMTDYSELAKRLREHAENMYVDFLNEAAGALEAQAKRIATLEELRNEYRRAITLLKEDTRARIAELEAANRAWRDALKGEK